MSNAFLSLRSLKAALFLVLAISLACTQIPLFNYLGFEFCALLALVVSLPGGLLTISFWNESGVRPARSMSHPPERRVRQVLNGSVLPFGFLLLLPLVIISANALFVKNCSFAEGLMLFLLLPVPALLFAHALALLVTAALTRWRRALFLSITFLILLHIPYVTLTGPQIFAFNPVIGIFPGFTYDESLQVLDRLAVYRVGTLAATAVLLLLAVIVERNKALMSWRISRWHVKRAEVVGLLTSAAIALAIALAGNRLGLSSSEGLIRSTLRGSAETKHFVITFPDTMVTGKRLEHLVQLHEFTFNQLVRELRISPRKKIHSFLYASAAQKGRLVGAGATNIAKPWLSQIHINLSDVESSLKHELAHVVAAEFGVPVFRVGINAGLIEGLAMAVERAGYDEDLHRLAAMVHAAGIDPDMRGLFSVAGFIKAHPSVSYTLAGSFCRFLIDSYGMRRFKMLYRTGSFTTFYNRELAELLEEWREFLVHHYVLTGADLQKAAYLFKRPTIFTKECARVIANLNAETRQLLARKDFEGALASATRSLALSRSIEAVFQRANALFKMGRFGEAIEFAESQLGDSAVAHSLLPIRLVLGDAYWAIDSISAARALYQDLLLTKLGRSWDEASLLRLEVLAQPDLARGLRPYFIGEWPERERLVFLRTLLAQQPSAPAHYLLARELAVKEQHDEAIGILEEIPRMKLDALEFYRQSRVADLYFAVGRYQRAKIYYWQALNYTMSAAQVISIEEKLEFCDWMAEIAQGEP